MHMASPSIMFTVGCGLDRPAGMRVTVPANGGPVRALAKAVAAIEPDVERWWSTGLFREDYREGTRWEGAFAAVSTSTTTTVKRSTRTKSDDCLSSRT